MKRKLFLISLMFIVLPSLTGQTAEQANILLNPGFEDNTGEWWGDVDYWEKGGNAVWVGSATVSSHEGSWSFTIGNDYGSKDKDASGYCLQVLRSPVNSDNLYPITPGDVVTFSMWMAGETNHAGKAFLKIEFYDYDRRNGYAGSPLKTFTSAGHKGAFDYLRETVTGTVPKKTVSVAVICSSEGIKAGSGNSLAIFDDGNVIIQPFGTVQVLITPGWPRFSLISFVNSVGKGGAF